MGRDAKPIRIGTDGFRGTLDEVTPAVAYALAAALVAEWDAREVVLAWDTRESGEALARAAAAGAHAAGAAVCSLGMVPTPAAAFVAAERQVPAVVITASHNPYQYNGIKFFSATGMKVEIDVEQRIEDAANEMVISGAADVDVSALTLPERNEAAVRLYEYFHLGFAASLAGNSLRLVVDCANGAMSEVAPAILATAFGDGLTCINTAPDGRNINDRCGAVHPEVVGAAVVANGADLGFSFDGDGDRVQAVDKAGRVLDGDYLIAIIAWALKKRGTLAGDTVVVSQWANLGFFEAMARLGVEVVETDVGDRHIFELLERHGWSIGGEQSGHVIMPELLGTGDGLLIAVQILRILQAEGREIGELADEIMVKHPQVARTVQVGANGRAIAAALADDIARVRESLVASTRLLVRVSGTEPVIRVMCQASTEDYASAVVDRVCALVEHANAAA
ncbi:MAG TPA: hypothetical protein VGM78_15765 [Ilumatobacteraceae bacterium]